MCSWIVLAATMAVVGGAGCSPDKGKSGARGDPSSGGDDPGTAGAGGAFSGGANGGSGGAIGTGGRGVAGVAGVSTGDGGDGNATGAGGREVGGAGGTMNMTIPSSACTSMNSDLCVQLLTESFQGQYVVALDSLGNVLLGGSTNSNAARPASTFVAKYNSNLEPVWVAQPGEAGSPSELASDSTGNVFLLGSQGELLLKLSPDGEQLWVRHRDSASRQWNRMTVDASGEVILAGADEGGAFLEKYSSSGDSLWTKEWSGGQGFGATQVAVDESGAIFVVTVGGVMDAAPASLVKCSVTGDVVWSAALAGANPTGLGIGPNGDAIVLLNERLSRLIVRYSSSGHLVWTHTLENDFFTAYALSVDPGGEAFAVGMANHFSGGGYRGVIAKYSPAGERLWGEELGPNIGVSALDLAAASDGSAFVTGPTSGTPAISAAFITHVSP